MYSTVAVILGIFFWCKKGEAFCVRPAALHRLQPEKDKQNVGFGPHVKYFRGRSRSSGVTEGGQGCAPPPCQAKCKKWGPLLTCISVFSILVIFSRFLFLVFSKISQSFPVISGVGTDESSSLHNQFAKIFVCV